MLFLNILFLLIILLNKHLSFNYLFYSYFQYVVLSWLLGIFMKKILILFCIRNDKLSLQYFFQCFSNVQNCQNALRAGITMLNLTIINYQNTASNIQIYLLIWDGSGQKQLSQINLAWQELFFTIIITTKNKTIISNIFFLNNIFNQQFNQSILLWYSMKEIPSQKRQQFE
ncbi:hypothetical protein ABPG72_011411 [Tetrahymena utriculariae]